MDSDVELNNERRLIQHYWEINHYEKALGIILSLLENHPNDPELIYLLAFTYYLLDEYDDALEACSTAFEKGYHPEKCQLLLGKIYLDKQNHVKSEASLLEALRINPNNPESLATYSILMMRTNHRNKAAQLIKSAVEIDPEDPFVTDAIFQLAIIENKKGVKRESLNRILECGFSDITKLARIGLFHLTNKNIKAARDAFRDAFLMAPDDKVLLENLNELNLYCSPWYAPIRWVSRIGGPAVAQIIFIVLCLIFSLLSLYIPIFFVGCFYIIYVIYSWTIVWIFKWRKRRFRIGQN